MFLGEDLDLWTAYKRISLLVIPLFLIWFFGFITYFWIMLFPLFTLPLSFLLGVPLSPYSVLLWFFIVEFHTLTIIIKTPLLFNFGSLILFKINPNLELLLLAVIFGCLPPIVVIGPYQDLLLRLSKDITPLKRTFRLFRVWKLPNSNRYKNYGEAKARIKHLIRKGTLKEKMAIFARGVSILGSWLFLIFYIFSLFGILQLVPYQVLYLWFNLIFISIVLLTIGSGRFMWNTIQ